MPVTVRIPTTMRPLTGGDKQVSVEPGKLSEVIGALEAGTDLAAQAVTRTGGNPG